MLENMTRLLPGDMSQEVVSWQVVCAPDMAQPKAKLPSSNKKMDRMFPAPGAVANRTERFRCVTATAGESEVDPPMSGVASLDPDVAKYSGKAPRLE